MDPRCRFIAIGPPAALPHVGLAHVGPGRVVHDPAHDRVGVDPAAEPRVSVLLLELRAEDGRGGVVPQLHQLQQHRPELGVRLVEWPLAPSRPPARPGRRASRRGRCGQSRSATAVHRPQPQDPLALILLAMWSLLVHSTAW